MNIRNIDNQKFGAIVPENKKVEEILFERLKTPKRYIQYKDIVKSQEDKKLDVFIFEGKNKRLEAAIRTPNGFLIREKENYFNALFNLSPIKFIEKICKYADDFANKYYK